MPSDPTSPIDLSLPRIERRLAEHRPGTVLELGMKRAAVACVLRFHERVPEVLLMKRAEREGDRWSGQVSFPGGREEASDPDLSATAMREAREEMGLDLARDARLLGRLDTIRAVARGGLRPLTVTPFVFVQTRAADLQLNHEAVDSFWLPLGRAAAGELAGKYEYKLGPLPTRFACWRYQGHVVWGMTYKMLQHLLDVVAAR